VYKSYGEEVKVKGFCYHCHKIANGLQRGLYTDTETLINIILSMPDELLHKWEQAFRLGFLKWFTMR